MPPRKKKTQYPQLIDPISGEVYNDTQVASLAASVILSADAVKSLRAELEAAERDHAQTIATLKSVGFVEGMSIPYKDGRTVVCVPITRRTAQRVDAEACKEFGEQLVECGIAVYELKPPTKKQIDDNRGKLVAHKVDINKILPQPTTTYSSEIQIV